MLDAAEALLGRIQSGADRFLACREVVFAGKRIEEPGRDDLADEMAAFANAKGGVLVLGASPGTRGVVGIPLDALDAVMQHVVEVASDSIDPPLVPTVEKLELPDPEGRMRPVLKV